MPKASASSLISNTLMMIIGAALAAGGYGLARVYAPPRPPGEVAGPPAADMVKPDDFKKLTERVDQMAADVDQGKKQVGDRPDFGPQLKTLNDRLNELTQTVTQMPAQFDSINQKLGTVSKIEDSNSPTRVDGMGKRVDDVARAVDALRADVAALQRSSRGPGGAGKIDEGNVDALAMEQAMNLFKAKKYAEARAAFLKLQAVAPNDARVWYYSALANGFASNQWLGETERMVNTGLEKEKAGQPDTAKVETSIADLTTATGKDWLAGYRQRIGGR